MAPSAAGPVIPTQSLTPTSIAPGITPIRPSTKPEDGAEWLREHGKGLVSLLPSETRPRVIPPWQAERRKIRRAPSASDCRPTGGKEACANLPAGSGTRRGRRSHQPRWATAGRRGCGAGQPRSGLRPPPVRASRRSRRSAPPARVERDRLVEQLPACSLISAREVARRAWSRPRSGTAAGWCRSRCTARRAARRRTAALRKASASATTISGLQAAGARSWRRAV